MSSCMHYVKQPPFLSESDTFGMHQEAIILMHRSCHYRSLFAVAVPLS